LDEINWTTVLVSGFASLGSVIIFFGGIVYVWGRQSQKIEAFTEKFKKQNGVNKDVNERINKQQDKDFSMEKKIDVIYSNCTHRKEAMDKNDKEHSELYSKMYALDTRMHTLEKGVQQIPLTMNAKMDDKFKEWRSYLAGDMQLIFEKWNREGKRTDRKGDS